MHFRPLHSSSRRVLPAVGFLTAVQMATNPALAGAEIEAPTEAVTSSASASSLSTPASAVPPVQTAQHLRMSRIVGAMVCDPLGERLGEVKDIVLDGHGALAYAVVAARDLAGNGDRWHAVPWQAMRARMAQGEQVWVLEAGKAALERDAGFSPLQWPDFADATWQAGNLRHYSLL